MTTFLPADHNLHFPDSDAKQMADNTEQYRWIFIIKENLEILFAADANVFVVEEVNVNF